MQYRLFLVHSDALCVLGRSHRKVPPDGLQCSPASVTADLKTELPAPIHLGGKSCLKRIMQIQKYTRLARVGGILFSQLISHVYSAGVESNAAHRCPLLASQNFLRISQAISLPSWQKDIQGKTKYRLDLIGQVLSS